MFDQMIAGLFDMAMLVAPWWQKQPEAVARAGLVVPLSQMPPVEIGALLRTHREGGDDATVAFVRTCYDRLFACPYFLPRLKDEWRADAFLRRRIGPLAQALDAHAAGLFATSLPTLLAQFEGLIADLAEHKGRMKEDEWRAHMTKLAKEDPFVGRLVEVFIEDVLAARFGHGGSVSSPLSRHAILHGGDTAYGTEVNSRTAILLVDYFAFVSRIQRGVESDEGVAADGEPSRDAASVETRAAPVETRAVPVAAASTRVDGASPALRGSTGSRRTRPSK